MLYHQKWPKETYLTKMYACLCYAFFHQHCGRHWSNPLIKMPTKQRKKRPCNLGQNMIFLLALILQGVQRSTVIFEFKISPSWIISTSKHWSLFWSWDRRQLVYGIKLCQVLLFGWIITILHFSRFTTIFAPKHFSNANPNAIFAHICICYITFGWYNVISCLKA